MKLTFQPYNLNLKHTFSIANFSRTSTPVVLTQIEHNGIVGYGEASLPQYLGETQESVCAFLQKVNLSEFDIQDDMDKIMQSIDAIDKNNTAAKASIDIALHDLKGKFFNRSVREMLNITAKNTPFTSYTIGIDSEQIIRQKVKEATPYTILKIKVNRENWKEIVDIIRTETQKPLFIDANQSWICKEEALENIHYLSTKNVLLIEQPLEKHNISDHRWLSQRSPLPIIADESVQRLSDLELIKEAFNGINIKLMKCTGINEAYKMILSARKYGLKVMLGCMTETSCAISAAAQLSPLVDFADLDGNLLITNDCFRGVEITEGRILLNNKNGIGVDKI